MGTLNNGVDWWNSASSQPYHNDLIIAANNSRQSAIATGHPENALTPQEIAQQIGIESGFKSDAVNSTSGATGIAQILPSTAAQPGYGISAVNPNDPHAAIQFAGAYDGAVGVTGYSHGGYSVNDLSPANGATKGAQSGNGDFLSEDQKKQITDNQGSDYTVKGKDVTAIKPSGLSGIVAASEEVFTRLVVVGVGLLLIFGGVIMFRPVQSAIKTVKPL